MTTLVAWPFGFQILDNNAKPAAGALVYSYVAGGNSTDQPTWTNSTGFAENTNPVVADANGRLSIFMDVSLQYHFIITDSTGGTTFLDQDEVQFNVQTSVDTTQVQINNNSANENVYPLFTNNPSDQSFQPTQYNTNLYYNPGTNVLTVGTISCAVTGNATTATTANNLSGGGIGYLPYQSAANTTTFLAPGTSGYYLTSQGAGHPPIWSTPAAVSQVYWSRYNNTAQGSAGDVDFQSHQVTETGCSWAGNYIQLTVAGDYKVEAMVTVFNQEGVGGSPGIRIYKNGVYAGGYCTGYLYNFAGGYTTLAVTGIISCGATDRLSIYFDAAGGTGQPIGYSSAAGTGCFTGYKLN